MKTVGLIAILFAAAAAAAPMTLRSAGVEVQVTSEPFGWRVVKSPDGTRLSSVDVGFNSIGMGTWWGSELDIYEGYSTRVGFTTSWASVSRTLSSEQTSEASASLLLQTSKGGVHVTLSLEGARLSLSLAAAADVDAAVNRLGFAVRVQSAAESFLGFGERFNAANQRGQRLYCWTEDGGFGFGTNLRLPKGRHSTYAPQPWYINADAKYALWLNTTSRTSFALATPTLPDIAWMEVEARHVDAVFYLHKPAAALAAYTADSGARSLIPPQMQFTVWNQFSNEIGGGLTELQQVEKFMEWDIPFGVNSWSVHFFPDGSQRGREAEIKQQNAKMAAMGVKNLCYFNSMIDSNYEAAFNVTRDAGMLVQWPDGTPYTFAYKGAGPKPFPVGLLDVTNPAAVAWFHKQMASALDMGFHGFMYDYGEYVDARTVFHNGQTGRTMHNAYPPAYQEAAFSFFTNLPNAPQDGKYAPDYIYYVRSGYVGTGGRVWAMWTGDPSCDFSANAGLPAQVNAMLSGGLSGIPFMGSDIPGFVWLLPPSQELWARWTQVGAFSGHMHTDTGGTSALGLPKSHIHDTKNGTALWRFFVKLRFQLLPYLYTAAHEAHDSGLSIMRQHVLMFPDDPVAPTVERQWMFGPHLLAAPVVTQFKRSQRVYLPAGKQWYDVAHSWAYDSADGRFRIANSARIQGGRWVDVDAPLELAPLFAMAGSVIPAADPSVTTPNNDATDKRVVTSAMRAHLLHAWVFPTADMHAQGSVWDGATFQLSSDAASSALFHVRDEQKQRTHIVQIALDAQPTAVQAASALPRVDSWKQLVSVDAAAADGWTWDAQQSTLWLRLSGAAEHSVHLSF